MSQQIPNCSFLCVGGLGNHRLRHLLFSFFQKKKKKTALNPCLWLAMPYEWGHAVHKSDFPISRLGYQISAIDTEHHTNSLHSNMEQLDGKHIKLTTVRNAVQLRPLEELCKLLPGSESIIGKNHCNMFFKNEFWEICLVCHMWSQSSLDDTVQLWIP